MNTESLPPSNVTANQVASRLQDASDPLAFVRQNLRQSPQQQPQPITAAEVPTAQAEAVHVVDPRVQQAVSEPSFKEAIENTEFPFDVERTAKEPVRVIQEANEETPEVKEDSSEENTNKLLDMVDKKKPTKEDSMREARRKIAELNTTVTQREEAARELEERIKKYETGEALPDIIREKEDRIAALERYEKLHNLRVSPEYQEKYVAPLAALSDKAAQIAVDYQVDPEVLNKAITIENKKEQNEFLRNYFDDVGALEARGVLDEIKKLTIDASIAEQEPQEAFKKLQEEAARANAIREQNRLANMQKTARDGWIEALTEVKAAGNYPELIMTGDPDNDKYVKPILEEASKEYGKFIQLMGAKKMAELPPQAAKILAQRFLLAQATSVAMSSRNHHYERSQEILENTKRRQSLVRPAVGASNVSSAPPPSRPKGVEAAADALLAQVMRGR